MKNMSKGGRKVRKRVRDGLTEKSRNSKADFGFACIDFRMAKHPAD